MYDSLLPSSHPGQHRPGSRGRIGGAGGAERRLRPGRAWNGDLGRCGMKTYGKSIGQICGETDIRKTIENLEETYWESPWETQWKTKFFFVVKQR